MRIRGRKSLLIRLFFAAVVFIQLAHTTRAQDDCNTPFDVSASPFLLQPFQPVGISPIFVSPTDGSSAPIAPHQRAPLSDDELAVVASDNHFALNIFQQLTTDGSNDNNVLVSPFSISTALAMTYAGARGETAQQMANVLGFSLPDDRLHPAFGQLIGDLTAPRDGYQLNIANRLFGQQNYSFEQPFLDTVANDYNAPLQQVNFIGDPEGSRQTINQWVADQTNNKIQNLLQPGMVDNSTRLVLTNAIYFDGQWKDKFHTENTYNQTFYLPAGAQTSVAMMHQQNSFQYANARLSSIANALRRRRFVDGRHAAK